MTRFDDDRIGDTAHGTATGLVLRQRLREENA